MQISGNQPAPRTIISYKDADWQKYRDFINKNLELNTDIQDTLALESEVDRLTKLLQEGQKRISKKIVLSREDPSPENP